MSSIVFVTFDIKKDDYPSMPYSVAAMLASLAAVNHKVSHYSFDLQHARDEKEDEANMTEAIADVMKTKIEFFQKFDFIAISLTAWTIEYVYVLFSELKAFQGKIILGGYEVTAMSEADLKKLFPRTDYFIKGYSETALRKILSGELPETEKIIEIPVNIEDTASPYQSGILTLHSRRIHWETKRGCPYKCGFCEWGNSTKNVFDFNLDRINKDIELFKNSAIEEINILDGTFNYGKNYLSIFKQLLDIPNVKITCQAKFERLLESDGKEFFELCKNNKNRIHLEFGLQSIHADECKTIGRNNKMDQVEKALEMLNEDQISYEVSIIYAIPGQTIHSFIDTIEYLIDKGCKTIRAYPLRIPKNSKLEMMKEELGVTESADSMNITSVASAASFSQETKEDMDFIANCLFDGTIKTSSRNAFDSKSYESFELKKISPYQWGVTNFTGQKVNTELNNIFFRGYVQNSINTIQKEDVRQYIMALGHVKSEIEARRDAYVKDAINGLSFFEIKNFGPPEKSGQKLIDSILENVQTEIKPRKMFCKAIISKSGNFYVFRHVEKND